MTRPAARTLVAGFVLLVAMVCGGPGATASALDEPPRPADWTLDVTPSYPEPKPDEWGFDEPGDQPSPAKETRMIRIMGSFRYLRPDGEVLPLDGAPVYVYDDDPSADDFLGSGITNSAGEFDFEVEWTSQLFQHDPDLLVRPIAVNEAVRVVSPSSGLTRIITTFGPYENYDGSSLLLNGMAILGDEDRSLAHIHSTMTRNWRSMVGFGFDVPQCEVAWPSDMLDEGSGFQGWPYDKMHLTQEDTWNEGTLAFLYGMWTHFQLQGWATTNDSYCCGYYDEGGDCGYSLWCSECLGASWVLGFSAYLGQILPATYPANFGFDPYLPYNFNSLFPCEVDGTYTYALGTPGAIAAALVDLDDALQDDDPHTPGYPDQSNLGTPYLLDILQDATIPASSGTFLDFAELLLYRTFGRDARQQVWFTVRNNGIDLDEDPPSNPTDLRSTSHTVGAIDHDPQLSFYWSEPSDDVSGIKGYSWTVTSGAPASPPAYTNMDADDPHPTVVVTPGTWYFNLRTLDWSGRWADGYVSVGPYYIDQAIARNLEFQQRAGWGYYVVPSNTNTATPTSCPLPTSLSTTALSYWNVAAINTGDYATNAAVIVSFYVDGDLEDYSNEGVQPAWEPIVVNNEGPLAIYAGRHTIGAALDPNDIIPESDETDNRIAKQFAWRPMVLTAGVPYANSQPVPDATGGWDWVPGTAYYNCYGISFNSSGWWNALYVKSTLDRDYDLRLFQANTDPSYGFRNATQVSARYSGFIDAVLVNRNQLGNQLWDAGITNPWGYASGTQNFRHVTSQIVAYGDSLTETMVTNQYLLLREFYVSAEQAGPVSIDLWTDPPELQFDLGWLDQDFTTGTIGDPDAGTMTGPNGHAHLEVAADVAGYYCILIARAPLRETGDDVQVTYRIRSALSDLTAGSPATAYGPIVPRNDPDITWPNVPLPAALDGDQEGYVNLCFLNQGAGDAPRDWFLSVDLDGQQLEEYSYPYVVDSGEINGVTDAGPFPFPAGRHTLGQFLDTRDSAEETDEENNAWGCQFVWKPPIMINGDTRHRTCPPDVFGGWQEVTRSGPFYYNCDGVRVSNSLAYWQAIVAMPSGLSDIDLRLHQPTTGPAEGFSETLEWSSWGPGKSEYILLNYELAAIQPWDVGVLRFSGQDDYDLHVVTERWLGAGPLTRGPETMGADEILHLWDLRLPAGQWKIRLENLSGTIDWGLSLHPANQAYMDKSEVYEGAIAYLAGPGEDESIWVDLPDQQYRPVTVYKNEAEDMGAVGTYALHITSSPAGVEDELPPPDRTRLVGVHPNPFNPKTTVRFELAAAGPVDLAVYDLTGRRVAQLVKEQRGAGRYEETWAGCDGGGQRLASGVYVMRLETAAGADLQKVVLVK